MAKYVRYDPTITDRPSPVTSLYDADMITYTLPPMEELLVVDDATWTSLAAPWAVSDGKLITFTPPPPPPTPAQILAAKIALGITVTSTGTPALSATYALDTVTVAQIQSVAQDANAGLGFPGDLPTFDYPDIRGPEHMHTFSTAPQIVGLYKAMRNLLLVLNTQGAILDHGGSPSWPAQTATIP